MSLSEYYLFVKENQEEVEILRTELKLSIASSRWWEEDIPFDITYFGDNIRTISKDMTYFLPFAQLSAIIETAPSEVEITDIIKGNLLYEIINRKGQLEIIERRKYLPSIFYSKYWKFEQASKLNLLKMSLAYSDHDEEILSLFNEIKAILEGIRTKSKILTLSYLSEITTRLKAAIDFYTSEALKILNEVKIDLGNYPLAYFWVEEGPEYIPFSEIEGTDHDYVGNPLAAHSDHLGIHRNDSFIINKLGSDWYHFNFPIFITDQHSGVYFWLKDAIEQGILSDNLPIIVFDSHNDFDRSSHDKIAQLIPQLNEVTWGSFTIFDGLVSEKYNVMQTWRSPTAISEEDLLARLEVLPSDISAIVSVDLDYFGVKFFSGSQFTGWAEKNYIFTSSEIDKEISRIIETIKNKNINVVALNISLSRKYSPYSMKKQDEILRKLLLALQEL